MEEVERLLLIRGDVWRRNHSIERGNVNSRRRSKKSVSVARTGEYKSHHWSEETYFYLSDFFF